MSLIKPIPDGYPRISPYLCVRGAVAALGLYGDRTGQFEDPFGHSWSVATHVEDVPPDEMARRAAAHAGGQ